MHLSKIARPFALALALAAAAGCATETREDTGGVESDITGSIQAARITRIKEAYTAAGVEAFTPLQPLLTDEQIAAWNFGAQDPHWFSFLVDGRTVYLVDFLADASALLDGAPTSPANPRESFVLFFDVGADQATYGTVLLYSADRDQWAGLTRALRDTKTTVTDGGVPFMTDGGSHSADGGTWRPDGGGDGGGWHSDGGTHDGGGADGGWHSDGGTHHDGGAFDGG